MSPNALQVDPDHVSLVLDNSRVRVIRVVLGPSQSVPVHSHPDSVGLFLTDAELENTVPNGAPERVHGSAGQVFWFEPNTHTTKNLGDRAAELVFIELK